MSAAVMSSGAFTCAIHLVAASSSSLVSSLRLRPEEPVEPVSLRSGTDYF